MPFRRRYRTTRKPRRGTRKPARRYGGAGRRRMFGRRTQIPRAIAFPRQRVVKMRYAVDYRLDPSLVSPIPSAYFGANNINDPEIALGGHRPLGYDQWSVWYNNYVVIGSKIRWQPVVCGSNPVAPQIVGARSLDAGSTALTNLTDIIENPRIRWRTMQAITNGNVPRAVSATYSAKKWWNLANVKDNQSFIGANFGSDPPNQSYFQIFTAAADNAADLPPVEGIVTLTYIVLLSEPNELPPS